MPIEKEHLGALAVTEMHVRIAERRIIRIDIVPFLKQRILRRGGSLEIVYLRCIRKQGGARWVTQGVDIKRSLPIGRCQVDVHPVTVCGVPAGGVMLRRGGRGGGFEARGGTGGGAERPAVLVLAGAAAGERWVAGAALRRST